MPIFNFMNRTTESPPVTQFFGDDDYNFLKANLTGNEWVSAKSALKNTLNYENGLYYNITFDDPKIGAKMRRKKIMNERFRTFNALNFHLYDSSNTSGYFQIPKLDATDWVPEDLIGFNYVLNNPDYTKGVHFFLDDYQFERVWNRPDNYVDKLSKFDCVLTPDFSLYTDFPLAMQIWNTYRSRLIGRYWQDCGVTVIPTVSWSTHESYNFCFDGLPENSILAISTVGVMKDKAAKELFYDGLEEMITKLHPTGILIWGQKIDYGFPPNIGVAYFKDKRIERVRKEHYGRKRNK